MLASHAGQAAAAPSRGAMLLQLLARTLRAAVDPTMFAGNTVRTGTSPEFESERAADGVEKKRIPLLCIRKTMPGSKTPQNQCPEDAELQQHETAG